MKRLHLFEFEDLSWCPEAARRGLTDFLAFNGQLSEVPVRSFVDALDQALPAGPVHIVDLCSGGGGPSPLVVHMLRRAGRPTRLVFTDLFPNTAGWARQIQTHGEGFTCCEQPVDATQVPRALRGLRLICNGFHHLPPEQAREVLADAVRKKQPVAVYEQVGDHPVVLLSMLLAPLLVWLVTPFIRPFRWDRLLLTYLLPVIPIMAMWDGIASCLRVYSPTELRQLVDQTASLGGDPDSFSWTIEHMATGLPGPATVLIGVPRGDDRRQPRADIPSPS